MTMIFGQSPSGLMVPVSVEETGEVLTSTRGLVGGVLQRNPLQVGYSGNLHGAYSNLTLPAGTYNLDGGVAPAGQIWIVTNWTIKYVGTITNVILSTAILSGGVNYYLTQQNGITSGLFYDRQGWLILSAGENLRLVVLNGTLNDDAYLFYTGFYTQINL